MRAFAAHEARGRRHLSGAVCLTFVAAISFVIVSVSFSLVAASVISGHPAAVVEEEGEEVLQGGGLGGERDDVATVEGSHLELDTKLRTAGSRREQEGAVRRRRKSKAQTLPPDSTWLDVRGLEQLKRHLELMRHQSKELRDLKSLMKSLNRKQGRIREELGRWDRADVRRRTQVSRARLAIKAFLWACATIVGLGLVCLSENEDIRLAGAAGGALAGYFSGSNIWDLAAAGNN